MSTSRRVLIAALVCATLLACASSQTEAGRRRKSRNSSSASSYARSDSFTFDGSPGVVFLPSTPLHYFARRQPTTMIDTNPSPQVVQSARQQIAELQRKLDETRRSLASVQQQYARHVRHSTPLEPPANSVPLPPQPVHLPEPLRPLAPLRPLRPLRPLEPHARPWSSNERAHGMRMPQMPIMPGHTSHWIVPNVPVYVPRGPRAPEFRRAQEHHYDSLDGHSLSNLFREHKQEAHHFEEHYASPPLEPATTSVYPSAPFTEEHIYADVTPATEPADAPRVRPAPDELNRVSEAEADHVVHPPVEEAELAHETATEPEPELELRPQMEAELPTETEAEFVVAPQTESELDIATQTDSGLDIGTQPVTMAETELEVTPEIPTATETVTETLTEVATEPIPEVSSEMVPEMLSAADKEAIPAEAELNVHPGTEPELEMGAQTAAELETESTLTTQTESGLAAETESATEAVTAPHVSVDAETATPMNVDVGVGHDEDALIGTEPAAELEVGASDEPNTEATTSTVVPPTEPTAGLVEAEVSTETELDTQHPAHPIEAAHLDKPAAEAVHEHKPEEAELAELEQRSEADKIEATTQAHETETASWESAPMEPQPAPVDVDVAPQPEQKDDMEEAVQGAADHQGSEAALSAPDETTVEPERVESENESSRQPEPGHLEMHLDEATTARSTAGERHHEPERASEGGSDNGGDSERENNMDADHHQQQQEQTSEPPMSDWHASAQADIEEAAAQSEALSPPNGAPQLRQTALSGTSARPPPASGPERVASPSVVAADHGSVGQTAANEAPHEATEAGQDAALATKRQRRREARQRRRERRRQERLLAETNGNYQAWPALVMFPAMDKPLAYHEPQPREQQDQPQPHHQRRSSSSSSSRSSRSVSRSTTIDGKTSHESHASDESSNWHSGA